MYFAEGQGGSANILAEGVGGLGTFFRSDGTCFRKEAPKEPVTIRWGSGRNFPEG
jgi:hypothetical protein